MRKLLFLLGGLAAPSFAAAVNVSYVGNSLTNDASPLVQQGFSESIGQELDPSFHIACSRSLTSIVNDPSFLCLDNATRWDEGGITADTDVLTLQPHSRFDATYESEVESALEIIDFARSLNPDVRVLIYSTWDQTGAFGGDFTEAWNRPAAGGDESFVRSRAGFELVANEIGLARPDLDLGLISVGDALASIDQTIKSEGEFAGYTDVDELYRDPIHLGDGRFLARAILWSAVTGNNALSLLNDERSDRETAFLQVASTISVQAIPEPSSGALAAGFVCLMLRRRVRSRFTQDQS